jgi:hypothetical protein
VWNREGRCDRSGPFHFRRNGSGMRQHVNRPAIYFCGALLAVSGLYAMWTGIRLLGNCMACETEELSKIEEPSGLTFEFEDTTCNTFGSDEQIRVYARKTTPKGTRAFLDWRHPRTLLFRYDPGSSDDSLPSITRPSQSSILISIPRVSSIVYQNREWEGMSINYDVGRVDYPAPK